MWGAVVEGACGSMPRPRMSRDGGPLSEERSGRHGGALLGEVGP